MTGFHLSCSSGALTVLHRYARKIEAAHIPGAKAITDFLRENLPYNREAWFGIETWEVNSTEPAALKEFYGAKLCRELGL